MLTDLKNDIISNCIFYKFHKNVFSNSIFEIFNLDNKYMNKLFEVKVNKGIEYSYFFTLISDDKKEYINNLYYNLVNDLHFNSTLEDKNNDEIPNKLIDFVNNGDRSVRVKKHDIEFIILLRECYFFNLNDDTVDEVFIEVILNFLKNNERVNVNSVEKFKLFFLIDIFIRFYLKNLDNVNNSYIIENINKLLKILFKEFSMNMYRCNIEKFNFILNIVELIRYTKTKNSPLKDSFESLDNVDVIKRTTYKDLYDINLLYVLDMNRYHTIKLKDFIKGVGKIPDTIDLRFTVFEKFMLKDMIFINDESIDKVFNSDKYSETYFDESELKKLSTIEEDFIKITKDFSKIVDMSYTYSNDELYSLQDEFSNKIYKDIELITDVLLDVIESIIEKFVLDFKINEIRTFDKVLYNNSIERLYNYLYNNFYNEDLLVRYSYYFTSYGSDFRNKSRHGLYIKYSYADLCQIYKLMCEINYIYKDNSLHI